MDPNVITFTPPPLEELQALLPQFQFTGFLAQGGMGAVYSAYQTSLERHVAIKVLPPELSADEAFATQFTMEARAMAKLNHPHLIGVYDFGEVGGMLFIVMELVSGGSLYESVYGQQIDPATAATIVAKLARGLAHAHQMGLLHRDVKPANVLLSEAGEPKIGDFGLAHKIGEQENEDAIYGTPGYTAPEVLTQPDQVDQRCDVFSLGVVLYELLTAQLPSDHFQPASALCTSDRKLDEIINRALQPDPAHRYQTADELAADLESAVTRLTSAVQRPALAVGNVTATTQPVRLKSASSGSGILAFLLLLLIAGGLYWAYANGYFSPKVQPVDVPPAAVE